MGAIQRQGINNTIITYSGIFIGFINNLIIMPLVLPKDELGLTRVLYSVAALFATIFPIGLPAATIKFFPKFRDLKTGHHGFLKILLLVTLISFVIFSAIGFGLRSFIYAGFDHSPMLLDFFVWVLPLSLGIGFVQVINVYCFSLFKSSFPLFLNEIFLRLSIMVLLSLYFLKIIDFDQFVIFYTFTFLLQLLVLFFYVAKIDTGLQHSIDKIFFHTQDKRAMLHFILLVAPASLASNALKLVDASMVGSNLNQGNALVDAAIYGIAVTIASIIEAPANALVRIADSKISDAINREDKDFIESIYRKSTRILMIIGGLLYVGVCINIRAGLDLIPGNFRAGYYVVLIIGAGAFVNMATGVNSSLVFYSSKYKQGTFLLFALVILTVLLNYILIPLYGIEGAAIGTASAAILFNIFKAIIIWKHFGIQPYRKYAVGVIGLMGLCLGINYFLPVVQNNYLDIIYRSVIITSVYGIVILFSGIFPEANGFVKKYTGISL